MSDGREVRLRVGDIVRCDDFRSEYFGQTGTVVASEVNQFGQGYAKVVYGKPADWEATGWQWWVLVERPSATAAIAQSAAPEVVQLLEDLRYGFGERRRDGRRGSGQDRGEAVHVRT